MPFGLADPFRVAPVAVRLVAASVETVGARASTRKVSTDPNEVSTGPGQAVASQGDPRPGGYYYYRNACYLPQRDGTYVAVSPAYCNAPPPQRYYSREVYEAPRCTRSPTFNPRDGTFIDRDGYRRRCV